MTAGVLVAAGLPATSTVAIASAVLAASLFSRVDMPFLCKSAFETALKSAVRIGVVLLLALPVAWADGVLGMAGLATASVFGLVLVYRYLVARLTCMPSRPRRVAILGTGVRGLEIAEYLLEQEGKTIEPVGFIDGSIRGDVPLPVLGDPGDLERIVTECDIDVVVVAFGGFSESDLVPALRRCEQLPIDLVVLPRFFELSVADLESELWGYPLAPLRGPAVVRSTWRIKRFMDIVGASIALLLAAPIMIAVALAVRLSSSGPIFYKQLRIGQGGRVFEMYKFRSMLENNDGDTTWTVDFDDRITTVGRFIRLTHLDELPQFFNVLRGEMSLVGPRPMRPHFVKLFGEKIEGYNDRHRVPVGITGWSQVNGLSGDTSVEARARLDNRYIESWSLSRDLLILAKTVPTVFKGHS